MGVMIDMKNRIEDGEGEDNAQLEDLATLLLDVALIKSGFEIDNEAQQPLIDRVDRIVRNGLKVSLDAALEEEPEFINEFEDEDDEDEDEDDEAEMDDDEDEDEETKEEL